MHTWTKRPSLKVKDKTSVFSLCCYRGRAQTLFFAMILSMMLLILYRITASESESPKVTRDAKKLLALEKMKKRTMENINEVMPLTQPSEHLAWQREYEGNFVSKDHDKALFQGQKLVHLDLKGAPPKISYYQEFFPLISSLGATGLLIEYEDMFPYHNTDIVARNAYTKEDIAKIIELATHNNLDIIPLIQTFGHFEFVLKLKKYKQLREVPQYPQVLCPSNNASLSMIKEMIDDVISLHPTSKYIHIGCDEVYFVGECNLCVNRLLRKKWTKKNLFMHHVSVVAGYIKQKYPSMTVLTWDDEFRQLPLGEILDFKINKLIEPVVWKYTTDFESQLPYTLWEKYSRAFPAVWIASAFKGATGPDKFTTDLYYHLENHVAWMRLVKRYSEKIVFKGIFLTGWQRYDHFAVLCELLPVGTPSLAVNLAYMSLNNMGQNNLPINSLIFLYDVARTWANGADASSPSDKAITSLKCDNGAALMRNSGVAHCSFPGSTIYDAAIRLSNLIEEFQRMMEDSAYKGWLTEYNVQMLFSNRLYVEQATTELDRFKMELLYIEKDITSAMEDIYDIATITEWVTTFIKPLDLKLKQLWEAKEKLLSKDDWPKRPLTPLLERKPGQ